MEHFPDCDANRALAAKMDSPVRRVEGHGVRWIRLVPWLALAGFFGLCDLAVVPCMDHWGPQDGGAMFVYAAAGPLFAQFGILPAWLAWGDRPYWLRLLLTWCAALLAFGLWTFSIPFGSWIHGREFQLHERREVLTLLLVLPALSIPVEAPLWLLRRAFGWRIVSACEVPTCERPLAIKDIMLATALVGVALGAARLAIRVNGGSTELQFWAMLGVAAASCIGASLALLPPIVWFALGLQNFPLAIAATAGHFVLLASIFVLVTTMKHWIPTGGLWGVFGVSVTTVTFAVALSVSFWLARFQGYRLTFANRKS